MPGREGARLIFGISTEKIIIVLAVAAFIIGPQRLPAYAGKLAQLVKTLRSMADGAKDRITSEMGPEFQDTDWKDSTRGSTTRGASSVRPCSMTRPSP